MQAESPTHQCHTAIRQTLAPGTAVTVLHIGAEYSMVTAGADTPATHILAIGSHKTAREHFLRQPPTPLELEQAIAAAEEAVMPLRATVPEGSALYTLDEWMCPLAATNADLPPGAPLTIERVEQVFNRLAAVSAGRPASQEQLPLDAAFYATVLILREFMHHLGFTSVSACTAT